MMAMNVEAEIRDLQRRVGELEGSFGFLTQQIKSVHKDLLGFQESMEHFKANTERKFEKVEATINGLRKEVRSDISELRKEVRSDINGLRKELPELVATTMREVLREQKAQSKKS